MIHTHQGLTLWYGTQDAPAPQGVIDSSDNTCIVVGVSPANASNTISVHYRVSGGVERVLRARLLRTEYGQDNKQFFKACFPWLPPGADVEYGVVCESAGRRVPDPASVSKPGTRFEVQAVQAEASAPVQGQEVNGPEARLPFSLDYICRFTIYLSQAGPEIIGETPEGLKVNWYPTGGDFVGPRLNGKLRAEGGDWMTIRPDGVGILGVRATMVTNDGALIFASYSGVFELGQNGYENFLKKKWPARPTTRHTPRFLTAHPQYLWLNRLQCIGIGEVRMAELIYVYDMYALR